MIWRAVILALAFVFAALPANANEIALTVKGEVQRELTLSIDDLKQMPQTKVSVTYQSRNGEEAGAFSGVALWFLLEQAEISDDGRKSSLLRRTITITGRDGYSIVIAAGEIAPDFEGKSVILALPKNGEDGLRLIVPGDKRGGRSVHDVVSIDVR